MLINNALTKKIHKELWITLGRLVIFGDMCQALVNLAARSGIIRLGKNNLANKA